MQNIKESFLLTTQNPHNENFWQNYYYQVFQPLIKFSIQLPYDVRYPYPEPPISSLPTFSTWYELVEYLSLPPTMDEAYFGILPLAAKT